ncbi:MAG TPA: SDR family NAD(P)-dependent oxidoreductase [Bryobacteraceae bacterium]
MQISLADKAALVTGSARGIGFAIARTLAESGASVLLTDIDHAALAEAETELKSEGRRVASLAGDLTHPDFPQAAVDKLVREFGAIDIIVNNAGYTWDSVLQKTTDEQFSAMLDIHVVAPFRVLRAALPWIREHAKNENAAHARIVRKVVNITSISGLDGNPGQSGYASGKAAVVGLTKTLAKEWGRYNITVNAVGFGLIDTRLIQPMGTAATQIEIGDRRLHVGMQAQAREQVMNSIPLRRMGTVEDAANAVFFFCSPLSDYVTGEVLVCGGGLRF